MKNLKELVERYHNDLPENIKSWLKNERGLSEDVINRFKLGWDGKAITIPIYGREKEFQFFKYRRSPFIDDNNIAKYWYSPNNHAELYGWEHITDPKSSLIICEGELDRLILENYNFPALTSTSGAGTFKEEWIEIISSLTSEIFICFDNDEAGTDSAWKIAKRIPKIKIVQIPKSEDIKDITDFILKQGVAEFNKLLAEAKTLEEIEDKNKKYEIAIKKTVFPPISMNEVLDVLSLTIKEDNANKLITFLCQLSAYTEDSQFNISFNSPSSTGKTYLPLEIASLFPDGDVKAVGYCSPTAFFHDCSVVDKERNVLVVDLSRQILIFLDQPHTLLLQHLRPLFSHDKKEILIKITDKSKGIGHRTKNILIIGFPAAIFCSATLKLDEQEATRFLLLSPEVTQEKIRQAIYEKSRKLSDNKTYKLALENNPKRRALKERIIAIKEEHIENIIITTHKKLEEVFLNRKSLLKPRFTRDIERLSSLTKMSAILNLWHRERKGFDVITNEEDFYKGLRLWEKIYESQEYNLPPYVYNLYKQIFLPLFNEKEGLTRQDIMRKHYELYERPLPDWELRRDILPMVEMAGLIIQEPDPDDRRRMLVYQAK